jgi:hypothetical protein
MSKKKINILDFKTADEIKNIIKRIGENKLTESAHTYSEFGQITISEAADLSTINYFDKAKDNPAVALISVVLAANRNYNKVVEPNIVRIEKTGLKTFFQLSTLLDKKTKEEFYSFWGHKDEKKYRTLKNLLESIDKLKYEYPDTLQEFELMNKWATDTDLLNRKNDIIGSIPNIGTATFQHLRMVFGVDTVKPDQRVKEVLDFEFGFGKLSNEEAIKAVEQIASVTNKKVITIDQILVKYGSGYYNQNANKISVKEIAKKLKSLGVDIQIICKATLLTEEQVKRL